MHLASTWPRLVRCLSTTFASPRLGGPPGGSPYHSRCLTHTRKALDTALIAEAIAAGVSVERGRSVQSLESHDHQPLAGYARRRYQL